MFNRKQFAWPSVALMLILSLSSPARAQDKAHPPGQNMTDMTFVHFPGMPTCSTGSVQNGDPTKGPSIILAKVTTGCVFPWHWHTPNEHLMLVSGVARAEMKDGPSVTLRAGGFALMPSQHVHRFTCTKSCTLYIYSDATFDIHYVDGQGQEIPPDDALKKHSTSAPATTPK